MRNENVEQETMSFWDNKKIPTPIERAQRAGNNFQKNIADG